MKWFAQGELQAWIKAHRVYLLFQHTHFQKGHLEMMLNVQIRDIDPNSVVLVTICLTLTSQVSKPWLPEADLPVVMRSRRWLESGLLCVLGLRFSQRLAKLDHCRHCSEEEPDCWGRRSSVTWHGQTIPLISWDTAFWNNSFSFDTGLSSWGSICSLLITSISYSDATALQRAMQLRQPRIQKPSERGWEQKDGAHPASRGQCECNTQHTAMKGSLGPQEHKSLAFPLEQMNFKVKKGQTQDRQPLRQGPKDLWLLIKCFICSVMGSLTAQSDSTMMLVGNLKKPSPIPYFKRIWKLQCSFIYLV